MNTQRSSRLSLLMSGLALVIAVAGVGGPAIARAITPNADRVDGFHAVGAGASSVRRAGRLVATDAHGWFPASAVNPASAFPEAVPPGATVRGTWFLHDQDVSHLPGVYWATGISFPARIYGTLTPEYVDPGAPTSQCTGTADAPEAAPGYLCLYLRTRIGALTPKTAEVFVSPYGAELTFTDDPVIGIATVSGSWAATPAQ